MVELTLEKKINYGQIVLKSYYNQLHKAIMDKMEYEILMPNNFIFGQIVDYKINWLIRDITNMEKNMYKWLKEKEGKEFINRFKN